jgi:beta-mannosidase
MKRQGLFAILLFILIAGLLSSCDKPYTYALKEKVILNQQWTFSMKGDTSWLPAQVPGCVHTDLLLNGKINDPFYRLNEKEQQWIDKKNWIYKCTFNLNSSQLRHNKIIILFKGLDTYAKISLNGNSLLETDNMFREWVAEIKPFLREGTNTLEIEFESPVNKGLNALEELGFGLPASNDQSEMGGLGQKKVSVFSRKAPYHFGWDWGPRFVTSGIWRPIELIMFDDAMIDNVFYKQTIVDESEAKIDAVFDISATKPGNYRLLVYSDGSKKSITEASVELEEGLNSLTIPFSIKRPELWWPNGMGKQHRYNFKAELAFNNTIIDSLSHKIGIRSIELIQEPDSLGKSFCFQVNGKRIFAKGANYIPNDNFLTRVTSEKYENLLLSAKESNMNMLRVWGGGIYEEDLFYDLCDEYGILVWQDFMFACSMYPGDDKFLDNVAQEVIDNVKRLRNHASIALWCGNNEIDAAWCEGDMNCGWGWKQQYTPEQRKTIWKSYDTLFHSIIPDLIDAYDQTRAYWPSSPTADWGVHATYSTTSGDMHYWGVWHGNEPFSAFYTTKSRFMSEYGFQSFPDFESVMKFTSPEDWNIESKVMRSHQRSGYGNSRIIDYMKKLYPVPDDFENVLYVSQVMQAEAIKAAILAHRANKPYTMGSLYWQLNDCWPVASWSSIDYYGKWKALQYFAKKAFAPVSISFSPDSGDVRIFLNSDLPKTRIVEVIYKMLDFEGNVLSQRSLKTRIYPTHSNEILKISPAIQNKVIDIKSILLQVTVMENGKHLASDNYFFADPKDLKLTAASLTTKLKQKNRKLEVTLSSDKLIKNLFLSVKDFPGHFSDNYFDLLPGEQVTVTMILKDDSRIIKEEDLKIISLNSIINQ